MRYWIALALLAAMLLAGCTGNGNGQSTDALAVESTVLDPGCYVTESAVEQQTNGAVRQYFIEQAEKYELDFMEQDVVLFFADEEDGVFASRFTGENCTVAAFEELPKTIDIRSAALRVEGRTLAYFNADDNSVVYLNDLFHVTTRKRLPHTITRQPVLGKSLYTVFYNIGSEVYAADMNAGIARLVRHYGSDIPVVEQTLFDDSALLCCMVNSEKQDKVFISAATGSPLGTDNGIKTVLTANQTYFVSRNDGIVGEILFGQKDSVPKLLLPKEHGAVYPALSLNGVIAEETRENGILLGFYDLASGARSSEIQLTNMKQVLALEGDDNGAFVWIVAVDSAEQKVLLRWDVTASAVEDSTDYSCQRYTLENPDQEGLSRCREKANKISQTYGVNVVLLQDVQQPQDTKISYEYQVDAIDPWLDNLERVLSIFPEDFFTSMQTISGNKGIQIGLVRGVEGATAEPEGLQYWINGDAHIALVVGENYEKATLHEISHVLDTYIYTNSILYDEWNEVNPVGFQYDDNYDTYLIRQDSPYLREGSQSFVDSYSMSFAKEDRARILECALTEGNEAVFASSAMQNKLLRVCRAIRDAYGWKKDTRTFPWEQYLNKSLAYVEKKK